MHLSNLKAKLLQQKKALAIGAGCAAGYTLDAWLLGTIASGITALLHKPVSFAATSAVWHNPLYAAVTMPFSPAAPLWLGENLFIGVLGGLSYFYLATIHPELLPRKKELKFSDAPDCGTSKWLTEEEARKTFATGYGPGTYIGALGETPLRIPNPSDLNFNVMVFGPPKSRKTRTMIGHNVMASVMGGNSIIITDPKGELYRELAVFLENQGYVVKVFNLVNPAHSDRFNPLSVVKTDLDAQMFAKIVIENTDSSEVQKASKGDNFWPRAELNLLIALILLVVKEMPKEERNMGTIYDILSCGNPDQIDALFKVLENSHPAKAPYNVYLMSDKKNRGGIVTGLATRLQVFANDLIKNLTSENEIHLELPGRAKCAYFCIISDTDSTLQFLSSLFFTFLFIKLTHLGDRSGGSCPVEVQCLLDEFCNIGAIPDFKKKISTMRSRGIACVMITQSLPQLVNRYPNNVWQEIISCCDTQMYLGVNDNMTAKELIDMLGKGTIETTSHRRSAGIDSVFDPDQITTTYRERFLMTLDETKRLNRNQAIVIVNGHKPMIVDKLDFSNHPLAKRLIKRQIENYNPPWAAKFKLAEEQLLAEEEQEVIEYLEREKARRTSFYTNEQNPVNEIPAEKPIEPAIEKEQASQASVIPEIDEPTEIPDFTEEPIAEQPPQANTSDDDDDDDYWGA